MNLFQTLAQTNSLFAVQSLSSNEQNINPLYGFKKNIVGLMANCLHENFSAQELLRKEGGLVALLNCTRIDMNNPFLPEYAIFAIRNAMKNNEQNQQFIANLQQQKMIVDEEIMAKIRRKL